MFAMTATVACSAGSDVAPTIRAQSTPPAPKAGQKTSSYFPVKDVRLLTPELVNLAIELQLSESDKKDLVAFMRGL